MSPTRWSPIFMPAALVTESRDVTAGGAALTVALVVR